MIHQNASNPLAELDKHTERGDHMTNHSDSQLPSPRTDIGGWVDIWAEPENAFVPGDTKSNNEQRQRQHYVALAFLQMEIDLSIKHRDLRKCVVALESIAANSYCEGCQEAAQVAQDALCKLDTSQEEYRDL